MKNIIYNDYIYENIFKYNKDTLIKYSKLSTELWQELNNKNLVYLNTPIKIDNVTEKEQKIYKCKSKIYLPFLKEYKTFYNETFTHELSTKDILLLMKRNLQLLKDMHNNQIIHNDLYPDNIMINNEFDIKFIDLDYAIINDSPIPFEERITSTRQYIIKRAEKRRLDKIDILDMYMYYLVNGNFKKRILDITNINSLNIQKYIKEEINSYLNQKRLPNRNYYFIDIINELIASNYESNIIEKRRKK